jgi:hypothetical protein
MPFSQTRFWRPWRITISGGNVRPNSRRQNHGGESTTITAEEIYDIKMDLRESGLEDMDWIHLAQDRDRCRALVDTVMNLRIP